MKPPTQSQQWPPQQPYAPPPHPHRRKKNSTGKTMVIVGAVVLAVGVVAIAGLALLGAALKGTGETARSMATTAGKTPMWTAEDQRTYLDMLSALDPGLVANEERAIRRAERICDRILNPPEGGTMSLERYVVEELSGGNATIDEDTARTVIGAIKVWCR